MSIKNFLYGPNSNESYHHHYLVPVRAVQSTQRKSSVRTIIKINGLYHSSLRLAIVEVNPISMAQWETWPLKGVQWQQGLMHRKPDNRLKSVAHYTSRTLYISLLGGFLLCHRRDHPFIHGCHRDPYIRQTRHHRGVLFIIGANFEPRTLGSLAA